MAAAFNIGDRVRIVDRDDPALNGAEGVVVGVEKKVDIVYGYEINEYAVSIPEEAPVYLYAFELEAVQ